MSVWAKQTTYIVYQGEDLRTFNQAQINQGLLKYYHTEYGHDTDAFKFDVTNGVTSLKNLEFVIDIVPAVIPLEIQHFTIDEGSYKVTYITYNSQNVLIFWG